MVPPDCNRRTQFAASDHFIEGETQLVTLTEPHPADARRQTLKVDFLPCGVQPGVQMHVVRNEFLDLAIGPVDVLRIAGQRHPTKRSNASAEERPHVGGHETREVERIVNALIPGDLANVVAVVERGNACVVELKHRPHMHRNGFRRGGLNGIGIRRSHLKPLLDAPADRQVTIRRIVCGCLIRQRIRPDAPRQHLRKQLRRVSRQSNGHCRSIPDRVFDHGHCVVEGFGPPVEVTRLKPLVDTVGLAFDGQKRGARHRRRKRLRPTHAAKPGRQYPLAVQVAGVMPAAHLYKRFVSALHDPLAADVDPRPGRHLPEHHQTGPVEFTKVFPGRPRRHQVRIGDQHPGRVLVRLEHADRLAGLHQKGFVLP